MPKKSNLTGQKFTRWTVIEDSGVRSKSGQVLWKCICECGNERLVITNGLKSGNSRSCGCLQIDITVDRLKSHGKSDLPEYAIWMQLRSASNNIEICEDWNISFERFYDDMGPRPSNDFYLKRLDRRIGYEVGNCVWKQKANLTRQRFGRLVAISKKDNNRWLCKCDCGNEKLVFYNNLVRGLTKSCGCLHKQIVKEIFTTHGDSAEGNVAPEYTAWVQMQARCDNENTKGYENYGGRGITVCERWLGESGYENFLADMGRRPTPQHSVDRYPNTDGNYEPSNCRWGTKREQAIGRRRTKWIEYNGEKMIQKEWAARLKVCEHTVARFLKMGKTIGDIMEKYKSRINASSNS